MAGNPNKPHAKPKAKAAPRRVPWLLWLAAILALTFAVYVPCLDNELTSWDDNGYVTENVLVAHPSFIGLMTVPQCGNYHPLTMASLALNFRLSGLNPASYHWLNLLLHLANTALVFFLVRALSGEGVWTTVATALFFGIHPMHVESVAWVAERKDVLYAFFYLLALLAYLRFLDTRRPGWRVLTWFAFVLSVASKPAAVVLPLALVALDVYRRRPVTRGAVLEKVPFFLVSIVGGLLTVHAQRSAGAIVSPHLWTFFQKILFASYATGVYVVKLFLPFSLSAVYPYPDLDRGPLGPEFYLAFVALAVLLPALVYLVRRRRSALFGIAFFFINIILVLPLLPIGNAILAERYTYVPYIGLFVALTGWLDERHGPRWAGATVRPILAAALFLLAAVSLVQTWKRSEVWRSSDTLLNDMIEKNPHRIWYAYWGRGKGRMEKGRNEEALADFNEALALKPDSEPMWLYKGNLLAELNRSDSALICLERAIALKPDYTEAISNRGSLKARMGDTPGGLADLSRAIALDPRFRDAYLNRASVYARMHEYAVSIADRQRAIELDPSNPTNYRLHGSIGVSLQVLNRPREAIVEFDEAIRSTPPSDPRLGEYHLKRSAAWWALRDSVRARSDAGDAVRGGAYVEPAYLRSLGL